jgi:hypothetical protein
MASLSLISGLVGAAGTVLGGIAENRRAQSEAEQMEARGKEEFAASQREAIDKRKEGELANSRVQALAAASGAGASNATITKLMTGIAGEADYNARTATFGGESRKRGLFDQASARRRSGRASLLGSVFGGFGQGLNAYSKSRGF